MLLRFVGKDIQDIRFEDWLDNKPTELHAIAKQWVRAIQDCGPDVEIIFHDNYPIGCVDNVPFAYVNAFMAHVNLGFFHGASLPDKLHLLEGAGKYMRHIKLRPGSSCDDHAIQSLMIDAYQDIKLRIMEEWERLKH